MKTVFLFILVWSLFVHGEKVLVYDKDKGIIFVDKSGKNTSSVVKSPAKKVRKTVVVSKKKGVMKTSPMDIHSGRKKDPPELYYKSGIEFYKNRDYSSALKNFKKAFSMKNKPLYYFWSGKAMAGLGDTTGMISVMRKIGVKYSQSDVADDALFELATIAYKRDNYGEALKIHKKIRELYPYGRSAETGMEFIDVSTHWKKVISDEILKMASVLKIKGKYIDEVFMNFQKREKLLQNGEGDSETVKKMKKLYEEKVRTFDVQNRRVSVLREHLILLWVIVGMSIFNITTTLLVGSKISEQDYEIDIIREILQGMNI